MTHPAHTTSDNVSVTDISFLIATAETVLSHFKITRFHIIGHSMGGLTSVLLARRYLDRILSFTNIKGNLAPEDCFLGRQIFDFAHDDPEAFLDAFIDRTRKTKSYANPLYASSLRSRVRAGAVRPIFESMMRLSDQEHLLEIFLALPCPKMFILGDDYRGLSYLGRLEKGGVELAQIAESGHFPMYSNPVEMYRRITGLLHRAVQNRVNR